MLFSVIILKKIAGGGIVSVPAPIQWDPQSEPEVRVATPPTMALATSNSCGTTLSVLDKPAQLSLKCKHRKWWTAGKREFPYREQEEGLAPPVCRSAISAPPRNRLV
jgi:hypothetical protein